LDGARVRQRDLPLTAVLSRHSTGSRRRRPAGRGGGMDGLPARGPAAVGAGCRDAGRAGPRRPMEELLLAARRHVVPEHAGVGGGDRAPARRVRLELAVSDGGGDGGGDPAIDPVPGGPEAFYSRNRVDESEGQQGASARLVFAFPRCWG